MIIKLPPAVWVLSIRGSAVIPHRIEPGTLWPYRSALYFNSELTEDFEHHPHPAWRKSGRTLAWEMEVGALALDSPMVLGCPAPPSIHPR